MANECEADEQNELWSDAAALVLRRCYVQTADLYRRRLCTEISNGVRNQSVSTLIGSGRGVVRSVGSFSGAGSLS